MNPNRKSCFSVNISIGPQEICPLCERKIKEGQTCSPLYNNQKMMGFAHKRCAFILEETIKTILDVIGSEE